MGLTAEIPRDLVPRAIARHGPKVRRLIGILLIRPFGDRDAIYNAIYGMQAECDLPCAKIMDVLICQARKALKPHDIVIRTEYARGWWMDGANKAKLRSVIKRLDGEQVVAT